MREKYESLSVVALKDLAKARALKNISALKKAEVVDAMVAEDRRLEQIKKHEEEAARQKDSEKEKTPKAAAAEDKSEPEKTAERPHRQEQRQQRPVRMPRESRDTRAEARVNANPTQEDDFDQ